MKKIKINKIGKILIGLVLALAMAFTLIPNETSAAGTKVSDPSTIGKFHDSLGDDASTEYSGRIWSDKTVFSEDTIEIDLRDGGKATVSNNSDFLVAYSALATSSAISGQTQAPVDVVFVIDTSGSMNDDMSYSDDTNRIVNTVKALNDSIEELMNLNDYTRVGVVAFSGTSEVLLPLGRYDMGTRTSGYGYNQTTVTNYFSLSNSNETLYTHVKVKGSSATVTKQRSVTGGTNIQSGIYTGMNMLAQETSLSLEVDGSLLKRVPALVLLSDGAPTYSSDSTNWWQPGNNSNDGPGRNIENNSSIAYGDEDNYYIGNGFKALMTGAYMKQKVDKHYGADTKVYTVGVGITGLSNTKNERDLAYATLYPNSPNASSNVVWTNTNNNLDSFMEAWNTYRNSTSVNVNVGSREQSYGNYVYYDSFYNVTHPTTDDISDDPDALKNFVDSYFDADSASGVANAFKQIVSSISISTAEVPTELKHADPINTGYITYTDPIGQYMEVKAVKGITYNGQLYSNVTKNSDGTYTVSGNVTSSIYGEQNLSDIRISVTEDSAGMETMEIAVPAALIPVRINTVSLNEDGSVKSHTNNGSFPIRVLYEVGLKDEIVSGSGSNAIIDTSKLTAEYINANTDAATGNINFYSNLYTGEHQAGHLEHTAGNATVEFEPSHTNPFYYMQDDDPIYQKVGDNYVQVSGTDESDLLDAGEYYYITDYYHGTSVEKEYLLRTGAQLKKVNIISKNGYLYREKGSPRLNRILEFAGHKDVNPTDTAEDFYYPTFVHDPLYPTDPAAGKYVIYLGNNGRLSMPGTATLDITKTVNTNGYNPSTDEFTFTVNFNGSAVLSGSYPYTIYDVNGTATGETGTISDGGTLVLENGERAHIGMLPSGTTYEVTENDYTGVGFTTTSTGTSGAVKAGETRLAEFVNTYNPTPVLIGAADGLRGNKVLSGRVWDSGDSFTFILASDDLVTPMPSGSVSHGTHRTKEVTVNDGLNTAFDFGTISYDAPGTYIYTISEKMPTTSSGYLPGVSYSAAIYEVTVNVTDNTNGALVATTTMVREDNDSGIYDGTTIPGKDATFTNTYTATSVNWTPVGTKDYTDLSGGMPLLDRMFQFKLAPSGTNAASAPMPATGTVGTGADRYYISNNVNTDIAYPQITFDQTMAGQTFTYQLSEVIPTTTVNGMTYDTNVYEVSVAVSLSGSEVKINVTYPSGSRVTFENTYDAVDAKATLNGTKTLTGREMLSTDVFNFTVSAANDAALTVLATPETKQATIDTVNDLASFAFSEMVFTKVGTYEFNIVEVAGSAGGMTYDAHTTKAIVKVTLDSATGELVAAVTYDNAGVSTDTTKAVFENAYEATFSGTGVSLSGTKTLTGKELVAGEYYFEVKAFRNGTPIAIPRDLVTHPAGDTNGQAPISFLNDVKFDEVGTYTFEITEQIPTTPVGGTTYDRTKYVYTVVVIDDGAGNLVVDTTNLKKYAFDTVAGTYETTGTDVTTIEFKNEYKPHPLNVPIPPATKVISGNRAEALKANEFQFELSLVSANPSDGITLPATTIVGNAADGTIQFGNLTITKAGTYKFKIREVIPADADKVAGITYTTHELSATLVVTDDRNGNLSVTVAENVGGKTFTNEYNGEGSLQLEITKDFTGRENDEWLSTDSFDFEVVILDPATLEALDNGYIVFPTTSGAIQKVTINADTPNHKVKSPVITFTQMGTYKFRVHEVTGTIPGVNYDPTPVDVVVNVTDGGNGQFNVNYDLYDEDGNATDLTFKNVYDTDSVELSGHEHLRVIKSFVGRENNEWLDTDAFTFTLAPQGTTTTTAVANGVIEMPDTTLTITNENKAYAHFGNIIFHDEGDFEFTIKETKGSNANITYDTHTRYVYVSVKDNGLGELEVTPTYSGSMTFTNTFTPTPINEVLHGTKTLNGRTLVDGEFTFEIKVADGSDSDTPLPAVTSVTNKDGKVTFGAIHFTKVGRYIYDISEKAGTLPGITYDNGIVRAVVNVTYGAEKGKLYSDVSYEKVSGESASGFEFINTYTPIPTASININASKTVNVVNGSYTMADGDFEFEIEAAASNPASDPVAKALKDGDKAIIKKSVNTSTVNTGTVKFLDNVQFTEVGTYVYTIHEIPNGKPGITYDPSVYTIKVVVSEDVLTAKLSAITTVTKGDDPTDVTLDGIKFNNEYKADATTAIIHGHKTLDSVHKQLEADEFTFKLETVSAKDALGNDITAPTLTNTEVKNTETGLFQFGAITFDTVGVYKYKVSEVAGNEPGYTYDNQSYDVTITVTDSGSGYLQAVVNGVVDAQNNQLIKFVNKYNPNPTTADIMGEKVLVDKSGNTSSRPLNAGEFAFELYDENGILVKTAENDANGEFVFENIPFEKAGVYEFTIVEKNTSVDGITYDNTTYDVVVTVKDVNAQLTVDSIVYDSKVEFKNVYTPKAAVVPQIGVVKKLEGRKLLAEEFTFVIEDEAGNKYYAKNDATGNVPFIGENGEPLFTYDKVGVYKYKIYEVKGDASNVTYDETVYDVTVNVTDDFKGNLVVEFSDDGKAEVFTNVYTADSIEVDLAFIQKVLNNKSDETVGLDGFTFKLESDIEDPVVAVSDKDGKAKFAATFSDADAGKTFTFKLSEVNTGTKHMEYDKTTYVIQVKVTKDDAGKLHAAITLDGKEVNVADVTFTNTYNPPKKVDTGDNSMTTMFLTINFASMLALVLVILNKKRRTAK